MPNSPYDIYEQTPTYSPKFMPDLSKWFSGPTATGAWLAADMWLIPKYLNKNTLLRSVTTDHGRAALLNDMRHVVGSTAQSRVGTYVRGLTDKKFMARTGASIEATFGSAAARRIGIGRLASSFSRFGLLFMAAEIGTTLGGMLGDAISAYQPSQYQNKRRSIETGGAFVDTRYAQTQRARAIQAIHNSQLSTRAAMGNEASFLHLER